MNLTNGVHLLESLAVPFEQAGPDTYRVQVPAATHDTFADGPRFRPRFAPVDGIADAVLTIERGFALAFVDRALRGAPQAVFGAAAAPIAVVVEVYPLDDRSGTREPVH